jgi:hypothetical protein
VSVGAQTPLFGPASAVVGASSRVMLTVSLVVAQTPLEIIHSKVFAPTLKPVTPEVGEPGEVTAALPARTVQEPVPTDGALPANVAVVAHTVWSDPAIATVGSSSRVMLTVSLDVGQMPLVIIHSNRLLPTLRLVTPEVGEPGVVTVALPAMTVHVPLPTVGVLPARVAVVEQTS